MTEAIAILNYKNGINTKSIVRTASCLGIKRVFIIGQKLNDTEKSIMGAHKHMVCRTFKTEQDFVEYLRANTGYKLVLVEATEDSHNLNTFMFPKNVCLMTGHEAQGFSKFLLDSSDAKVHTPIIGPTPCLNTSVAFGIAACKMFMQKVTL